MKPPSKKSKKEVDLEDILPELPPLIDESEQYTLADCLPPSKGSLPKGSPKKVSLPKGNLPKGSLPKGSPLSILSQKERLQEAYAYFERLKKAGKLDPKDYLKFFELLLKYDKQIEEKLKQTNSHTAPALLYRRPKCLSPKQNTLVDVIAGKTVRIILIEGDRRTGKSTCAITGIIESILDGSRPRWGMWASKEATCQLIHRNCFNDAITIDDFTPVIVTHTSTKTVFCNGGYIETHATTVGHSSGLQYSGIWMDEFQTIIAENPDVFGMIVGILRSEPDLKLVMTANMGSGVYQLLKIALDELTKLPNFKDSVGYYTLMKEDVTHISETNDILLQTLLKPVLGEAFVNAQYHNSYNSTQDIFPVGLLQYAKQFVPAFPLVPYKLVLSIDPSVAVHPIGWCLVGICLSEAIPIYYEISSGEFDISKEGFKIQSMVSMLLTEMRQHHCTQVIIEKNSSAGVFKEEFMSQGYDVKFQNFGPVGTPSSKSNMLTTLRLRLDEKRVMIKNQVLVNELSMYDPKKSDKEEFKGDLADAFIHAIYYLYTNFGNLNLHVAEMETQQNKTYQRLQKVLNIPVKHDPPGPLW